MRSIPEIVKQLIIINVLFFAGSFLINPNITAIATDLLALHYPSNDRFGIWQLLTHMFMHGGFTHILFNMFGYGILVAFAFLFPNAELMLLFLPVPVKAKYFVPGVVLLDTISALTGRSFFSPSNTAFIAHIGGAISGFIIMWYWKRNQFNQKRWN